MWPGYPSPCLLCVRNESLNNGILSVPSDEGTALGQCPHSHTGFKMGNLPVTSPVTKASVSSPDLSYVGGNAHSITDVEQHHHFMLHLRWTVCSFFIWAQILPLNSVCLRRPLSQLRPEYIHGYRLWLFTLKSRRHFLIFPSLPSDSVPINIQTEACAVIIFFIIIFFFSPLFLSSWEAHTKLPVQDKKRFIRQGCYAILFMVLLFNFPV